MNVVLILLALYSTSIYFSWKSVQCLYKTMLKGAKPEGTDVALIFIPIVNALITLTNLQLICEHKNRYKKKRFDTEKFFKLK